MGRSCVVFVSILHVVWFLLTFDFRLRKERRKEREKLGGEGRGMALSLVPGNPLHPEELGIQRSTPNHHWRCERRESMLPYTSFSEHFALRARMSSGTEYDPALYRPDQLL